MTSIAALCGDGRLLDAWRRDGFAGAVHSVFERVLNLTDASGALVSLAVRSLDNAPNTLLIDAPSFDAYAMREGMAARTRGATLHIDEARFALHLDRAAAWHAQLPRYPRDDSRLRANLAAVRASLAAVAANLGEAPGLLDARSQEIARALQCNDSDGVRGHGRALLGLGPGLTPSGDDFLVGLFAVLNIASSPCHHFRSVCDEILAGVEARTHAISIAALREAARGRVRESIQKLLGELVGGSPASTLMALERVLSIGATSGRDIVEGIVCGLGANVAGFSSRTSQVPRERTSPFSCRAAL